MARRTAVTGGSAAGRARIASASIVSHDPNSCDSSASLLSK
jgi:hypothetical protein